MKCYYANGSFRDIYSVWVRDDENKKGRFLSQHTRHSPDGHAWGYNGSGPAQLALDIIWDLDGVEPEAWFYQQFKVRVISKLDEDSGFVLTEEEIKPVLQQIVKEHNDNLIRR